MIKLQPGDYVSTEGMTEDQYHAVCKAFMGAGAGAGGYPTKLKGVYYVGFRSGQVWHCCSRPHGYGDLTRKLTIDQILGSDNTEGTKEMNMSVEEAYKVMQANCGIEVGDTVKVLRKAEDYENGWNNEWDYEMDKTIGESFIVYSVEEIGIYSDQWEYPFFVLEVVKKGKKLPEAIYKDGEYICCFNADGTIHVGVNMLDFDLIEKIYMTAKEVKEEG